jgi:hypothetical protein
VSAFVLLIGLMASPILGILFSALIAQSNRWQRLQALAWLPAAIGAALALVAAWALRGQSLQTTIGNWSPVSFTGMPLLLQTSAPTMGVLLAWVTVYFMDSLRLPSAAPFEHHPAAPSLIIASLTVVALSGNFITLLVGLGLTDILSAYFALRRQKSVRDTLIAFVLNGLSLTLLLMILAVRYASGSSLQLSLLRLPETDAPIIALAMALRLGFLPFRPTPAFVFDLRGAASAIGGLLVLVRLPELGLTQLPLWFYALAIAGALVTLVIVALQRRDDATFAAIATAGLYVAALSVSAGVPGVTAAGAMAWLLGCGLIAPTRVRDTLLTARIRLGARALGGLCLIGLPLTVGFIGRSGATAWAGQELGGVLVAIAWLAVTAVLTALLMRFIWDEVPTLPLKSSARDRAGVDVLFIRQALGWLAAALPLIVFGLAPGLLDAGNLGDAILRTGIIGWLTWIAGLAGGLAVWRWQPRWSPLAARVRERTVAVLDLGWLYGLLGGAGSRLSGPFARVFTFLESDGALVWAVILGLLLLLISRPGGP